MTSSNQFYPKKLISKSQKLPITGISAGGLGWILLKKAWSHPFPVPTPDFLPFLFHNPSCRVTNLNSTHPSVLLCKTIFLSLKKGERGGASFSCNLIGSWLLLPFALLVLKAWFLLKSSLEITNYCANSDKQNFINTLVFTFIHQSFIFYELQPKFDKRIWIMANWW